MHLTYSDQVPTVPGWYWQRGNDGVRVVSIPYPHMVTPWRKLREIRLSDSDLIDSGQLEAWRQFPESFWRIEYAGPIQEPR